MDHLDTCAFNVNLIIIQSAVISQHIHTTGFLLSLSFKPSLIHTHKLEQLCGRDEAHSKQKVPAAIAAALLYAGKRSKQKKNETSQTGTVPSGENPETD